MNFKEYAKNNKSFSESDAEADLKKTYDETVKRMRGKSQKELMDEIVKEAERAKRDGRLDKAGLQNFYKTVAPMLDKNQLKKLKEIMDLIDD